MSCFSLFLCRLAEFLNYSVSIFWNLDGIPGKVPIGIIDPREDRMPVHMNGNSKIDINKELKNLAFRRPYNEQIINTG